MIRVENVHKRFGTLEVLKGVSIDIEKGEAVVLIGPSGSGKSTLLQCINGLEPIQKGRIEVDGTDVFGPRTDLNLLRRRIGIVFQQYNIFPHLTALGNVTLALRKVLGKGRGEAEAIAIRQLDRVGLGDKSQCYPGTLSGGQTQRLAIARALAMEPEYMLLDEITSALDPELVGEVLMVLRALRTEGLTMLVVTHEMDFARDIADRLAFFDGGVIVEAGPPAELFDSPKTDRLQQFLRRLDQGDSNGRGGGRADHRR
jgi:polar amino acid transport system ATP-binding protein